MERLIIMEVILLSEGLGTGESLNVLQNAVFI
jgi:hypothetical protein